MSQTVSEFLREKLMNMATWVESELGKQTVDLKQYVADRSETEIAYFVGILHSNSMMIAHKDWSGFSRVSEIPQEWIEVVDLIRKNEGMHDKFWRYLELFVAVISNE